MLLGKKNFYLTLAMGIISSQIAYSTVPVEDNWTGVNSNLMSDSGNWQSSTIPDTTAGDLLRFGYIDTTHITPTQDIASTVTISGIDIDSLDNFDIRGTGSNSFTLESGFVTTPYIMSRGTVDFQMVTIPLILSDTAPIINIDNHASSAFLYIYGAISGGTTESTQLAIGSTYSGPVLFGSNSNDYVSDTYIYGQLLTGATGALSAGSHIIFASDSAFLNIQSFDQTIPCILNTAGTTGVLNLGSNASLTINSSSTDSTFNGSIQDTSNGSLVKDGSAALTLTGTNSYTGGTTFLEGYLILRSNSALGTGTLTANPSSLSILSFPNVSLSNDIVIQSSNLEIDIPTGTTGTLLGSISTTDSTLVVTKYGAGTLALSGNSSGLTGLLQVVEGDLLLNSSLGGGLTLSAGTSTHGTGTVGGNLTSSGHLSPGNSSGIMHVSGNATFTSGSTFNIDCDANGVSQLIATGTVTIDSGATISLTALPGFSISSAVDTFIIESSGLSGAFSTVEIISPVLINSSLIYSADDLLLHFALSDFGSIGLKGNPLAVGIAFDEVVASGSTALNGVIDTLISFTTAEISSALNQMQPALFKGLTISQENNAVKVQNSLGIRMQNEMDRKSCYSFTKEEKDPSKPKTIPCSKDESMVHVWVDGFGDILRQKSNFYAESSQFGYQNKTGGAVVGLDGRFAEHFYVGALGGYTGSDIHWMNGHGKGDIDTGYGGLYFSALGKMFYANAAVIGSWSHFHAQRNIVYPGMNTTAKNNHGGAQILSHLDTGINIGFSGLTVRPFDSFDYISQSEGSYKETGAGALNLKVNSNNSIMLRNELGLQFAGCFCVGSSNWTLSPKISWVREVRVKGAELTAEFVNTAESFEVTGYFPDRSLVAPGVMVSGMLWEDRLGLDLYYNGEFGDQYSDHNYGGQIRFGF